MVLVKNVRAFSVSHLALHEMDKRWKLCLDYHGVPRLINSEWYFLIEPTLGEDTSAPLILPSIAKIFLSEDKRTLKRLLQKDFGSSSGREIYFILSSSSNSSSPLSHSDQ